jgi:HAUS augmin-like complex subunit 1
MSLHSTSTIFSPTLARQALATTKDWNYVDAWLSRHFAPGSPPAFERNADTLRALLALAAVNESVDEENDLLSKADARCLAELRQNSEPNVRSDLLGSLESNLTADGKKALDALSETAAALNLPFGDTEQMATRIMNLQSTAFNLEQIGARIDVLLKHMQRELQLGTSFLHELNDDKYQSPPGMGKQTMEYQRKTKLLAAKLPELRERISALAACESTGKPTIQDIGVEEKEFRSIQVLVKDLEGQLKSYHGLPHDTDLARLELETLRAELTALKKERDGMFEGLVERESPKKQRITRR